MPISVNGANGITFADGSIQNTGAAGFGFKNRIINGAMVIDQRNAGAATSTHISYPVDRWVIVKDTSSGSFTIQQSSTAPAGFAKSLVFTVGTAYTPSSGENNFLKHHVEGFNVADLNWGSANAATVTLSFWVRSSLTGTFGGSVRNGSSNRSYPFSYTISAANTFEYKSITITGDTTGTWDTTTGTGVEISWGLSVGSTYSGTANAWVGSNIISTTGATNLTSTAGATFYITGVQLEKGSTATAFDYRDYGNELRMCQRYFQKCDSYSGTAQNATNWLGLFTLQQTMRTTPSIGQTGAVYIADYIATDLVQSSASASIVATGGGGTALVCYLFNYSGMTAGKIYFSRMLNSNAVTFSAEL